MPWLWLLLAAGFELGFTTALKLSEEFTRAVPTLLVFVLGGVSFWLLSKAMQAIPLGTAYAVWTGIGTAGTALIGMLFFQDPISFWRVFFIATLLASVAGLRLIASP